jgi:hypothetical protein
MPEYIERTEELMLAMNAGARAIENTKRYHGAVYTKDLFADNSQKIPYLLAAKVLREVSDALTVDAVVVTRCKDCKYCGFCGEATNLEVMGFYGFCSRGKRKDGNNVDDHD